MLNQRIGLKGRLHWRVINQDGSVDAEGEQSNLILTQGLEQVATYGFLGLPTYAHVGTSNTQPDIAQTGLGASLGSTNATGGVGDVTTYVEAGLYRIQYTREFTETQVNGNLTEWGFGPTAALLAVRELFRDANGAAIVVTKQNGQKLRLIYTLEVRISPTVATAGNVNITNLGGRTGTYIINRNDQNNQDLTVANNMARGIAPNYSGGASSLAMCLTDPAGTVLSDNYSSVVIPAYVAGSQQRGGYIYTFDTAYANGTIRQAAISHRTYYGGRGFGYIWTFDGGQEIVKTNLDKLVLQGPSVSWGRA